MKPIVGMVARVSSEWVRYNKVVLPALSRPIRIVRKGSLEYLPKIEENQEPILVEFQFVFRFNEINIIFSYF